MADELTDEGQVICAQCQSVLWAEFAREGEPGVVVMTVGESQEQLRRSRCPICRLLSIIKPRTAKQATTELRLFSTRDALALRPPQNASSAGHVDGRCISFSESKDMYAWKDGFLALSDPSNPPDYDIRHPDPNKVDIGFIQQCLAHCRESHGRRCKTPMGSAPSNLRVIDCQRFPPEVVPAPSNCQYAALSYIWGSPQISTPGGQSSEKFPRVVSDAIMTTTMLGMQYLWVDSYCINQDDASHKHQQIQQMGAIYSHSEVTLIAASGSDASHGLPGLGSVGRLARARLQACGVVFEEGPRHVGHFVKASTWMTRGWTLQETFLPRRRVIFTESEAAFLCNCTHAAESWKMPFRLPGVDLLSIAPLEALTLKAFFSYGSTSTYKARAEELKAILEQYTTRKLTYQSDALNACTGVLKIMETGDETFHYGLLTTIYSRRAATANFTMWLVWYHKNPSRRRPEFPSWSFLGWEGPATMGTADDCQPVFWKRTYEEFNPGNGDEKGRRPPCLAIESPDTETGLPRRLRLQGRMLNIRLRDFDDDGEMQSLMGPGQRQTPDDVYGPSSGGVYAELKVAATGMTELRPVCMDSVRPKLGVYKAFPLWVDNDALVTQCSPILLFGKYQDVFERVGIVYHGSSTSIWVDDRGDYLYPSWELSIKHRTLWMEQGCIETIVVA
ncbi:hypothetical protein PG993_008504 [Apiospora rasikravindrae]|uniref:Heterokaryon incompatibility domain-containing protein n=1 Tax=Apiospora rasikravindrae TaxID=990691 RepID=A0ABR1T0J7_9PEZI